MKKSKITAIAALIAALAAACFLVFYILNKRNLDDYFSEDDIFSSKETDELEDLDVPELPEKEERIPARVRRGYTPIRLGREVTPA